MAATNSGDAIGDAGEPLLPVGPDDVADRRGDHRRPAARYSGVFVGLMKRVASFRANGRMATSQPLRYDGSSS